MTGSELIGVIQIINNKAGVPFGTLTEDGVAELSQTLAIAFKQRQKPTAVKTKYDYLIADAVLSARPPRAMPISYVDVVLPVGRVCDRLRAEQTAHFATRSAQRATP